MRTQFLLGSVNVVFPDEVVFVNDRNTITLSYTGANNYTVGALFTLTNGQGVSVQLAYESEQKYLTFNLLSTFKKLIGDDIYNTVTLYGSVTNGQTSTNITPLGFKLVDGRTLHSRPHNAERVVYYYDNNDLYDCQILSLTGGTVGQTVVSSGITKFNWTTNLDSFQMTQVDGTNTRTIDFIRCAMGGDTTFQTGCEDGNEQIGLFKVRYINTDGCYRYLQGKIQSRKRTVGYTEWRADEQVRHTPNGLITTTTDEVTVGFPSVSRLAYADDIMYSPIIQYQREDGEWQPCIISSKSLTMKDWNTNDLEITFKTLA